MLAVALVILELAVAILVPVYLAFRIMPRLDAAQRCFASASALG